MICKGVCVRYKVLKSNDSKIYANGKKRCTRCSIFIKYDGLYCPCCGCRLRTKPRNRVYKAKLRESQ